MSDTDVGAAIGQVAGGNSEGLRSDRVIHLRRKCPITLSQQDSYAIGIVAGNHQIKVAVLVEVGNRHGVAGKGFQSGAVAVRVLKCAVSVTQKNTDRVTETSRGHIELAIIIKIPKNDGARIGASSVAGRRPEATERLAGSCGGSSQQKQEQRQKFSAE